MSEYQVEGDGIAATYISYALSALQGNQVALVGGHKQRPDSLHAQCVLHRGSFYASETCAPTLLEAALMWDTLLDELQISSNRGLVWCFPSEAARNRLNTKLTQLSQKLGLPSKQNDVTHNVAVLALRKETELPTWCMGLVERLPEMFRGFDSLWFTITGETAVCPVTVLDALRRRCRLSTVQVPHTIRAYGRAHWQSLSFPVSPDDLRRHRIVVLEGDLPRVSFVIKKGVKSKADGNQTIPINVIARKSTNSDSTTWLIDCANLDFDEGEELDPNEVVNILSALGSHVASVPGSLEYSVYEGSYVLPESINHDMNSCVKVNPDLPETLVRLDRFTLAPLLGDAVVRQLSRS